MKLMLKITEALYMEAKPDAMPPRFYVITHRDPWRGVRYAWIFPLAPFVLFLVFCKRFWDFLVLKVDWLALYNRKQINSKLTRKE